MEKVLCFSRFLLEDQYGWFDGVSFNNDYAHLVMNEHNHIFVEREQAEKDKHYKQIIPYVIFMNEKNEIFNYKRGSGGGEDRLKNLRSIGIGGHISSDDLINCNNVNFYNFGLYREVAEEFGLNDESKLKSDCFDSFPLAFINEEDTEVGQVHFGSVHILSIDENIINFLEEDVIVDAQFSQYNEIIRDIDSYENWSQLCLSNWSKINEN
jgi:predicted NUDIX family phosphoesterase